MDHKVVLLVREAQKDIPDVVLETALLNHGAYFSAATTEVVEGRPTVTSFGFALKDSKHTQGALGEVKDVLEATKETKTVLCFSNEELDPQPFSLIVNEKSEDELVAFLDGDFSEKGRDNEGHSDEYVEANDYLSSKVLTIYEAQDNDVPKTMTALEGPNLSKELGKIGNGEENILMLVGSNGKVQAFNRPGTKLVRYDWGFASHDLDMAKNVEVKPPEAKKEEPKVLTMKEKIAAKRAAAGAPAAASVPAVSQTQKTNATPAKLNDTTLMKEKLEAARLKREGGTPTEGKTHELTKTAQGWRIVKVDPSIATKNLRGFLQKRFPGGSIPTGLPWEKLKGKDIVVQLSKLKEIYPGKTIEKLMEEYPEADTATVKTTLELMGIGGPGDKPAATPADQPQPDAHPDNKGKPTPASDQPVVIPPEHKKNLEDRFFSKSRVVALIKDRKDQNIMDPALTAMVEDKMPEFWEGLKKLPNLESTFHFKSQDFQEMGTFSLNTLATAAFNYKNHLVAALQEIQRLKPAKQEAPVKELTMKEKIAARRAA